jgi:hypothetical protein
MKWLIMLIIIFHIIMMAYIIGSSLDRYHNQEIQKQDSIILMLKEIKK